MVCSCTQYVLLKTSSEERIILIISQILIPFLSCKLMSNVISHIKYGRVRGGEITVKRIH